MMKPIFVSLLAMIVCVSGTSPACTRSPDSCGPGYRCRSGVQCVEKGTLYDLLLHIRNKNIIDGGSSETGDSLYHILKKLYKKSNNGVNTQQLPINRGGGDNARQGFFMSQGDQGKDVQTVSMEAMKQF